MATEKSQVPPDDRLTRAIKRLWPRGGEKSRARLQQDIESHLQRSRSAFPEDQERQRRYSGEAKANYLLSYFRSEKTRQQQSLLQSLRTLQEVATAFKNGDVKAIHKLGPAGARAHSLLHKALTSLTTKRSFEATVNDAGLVLMPTTAESKAALAILLLDRTNCLTRLRKCRHCGEMFYARFPQQKFCSDPMKECQWNHYHTPEWRKRNRERNRRHQSEYRKRNPGRRR
jgi:hypothetical protein